MSRKTLEQYRSGGDLASLEEDWLARADAEPTALDWFLGLAQELIAAGETERAHSLLELYDAELVTRGLWEVRLELLRKAGAQAVKAKSLHKEVLASLHGRWTGRPTLASAIEHVALHKPTEDPTRLWDKVTRLQSLLSFDVGEVVLMPGQGVGRVTEVNLELESLRIDFDKRSGVTLGLRAAAKMLKALPAGNLLRSKLEDPAALDRLRDERPAELLRAVLESNDKPMTGAEIRDTLVGIVPEAKWAAWWATARKHPQVVASSAGRQSYRWEASQAGALAAVRKAFARADPRARLELLRKNAERDPQFAREMAGDLASLAGERAAGEPGLAFEIWFALERAGFLPESLAELPARLTGLGSDLRRLLGGIEDRLLRERALAMARERRPDWPSVYKDHATREEDPRVLDLLFDGLRAADAAAADRVLDDLVAQPRRAPAAFVWLAERAAHDEPLRARGPMRLLQQVLSALADPAFARFRVRLRALCESGATVPRLFAHLEPTQAAAAVEALRRAGALENYARDPLVAALEMRFPALRESDSPTGGPLYATSQAIEAKRSELKHLTEVDIPANRKAIAEARAMGDLRENFEYKAARERHEYLNARLAAMHRELGRARPIDFGSLDTSEVRVGTRVRLAGPTGAPRRLAILGPWESKPEQGVLSYESEMAKSLLGLKAGDSVEIGGERLRVEAIEPAL